MSKTRPYPLPITGIDMLSNETALPPGAVRSAVNIDIGRSGHFSRRSGYTRHVPRAGMHSLYHAAQKGLTVVAQDAGLHALDTGTLMTTLLFPLNSADKLEYVEYNGNLYFSSRTTIGWVPKDADAARPVGVPVPAAPLLSAAAGSLLPGSYGVVLTFVDDRGEESGASELRTITLPKGGGVRMENLPLHAGWALRAYLTSADGDVLRSAAQFPAVFPTYVVADDAQGGELTTQFLVPMPPGDIIRWHNGRLYTAHLNLLRFSQALRPHLHNPAHGLIPFSGSISFVEAVADGIYVGDSRGVWFLSGADPTNFSYLLVSSHRAVLGSSMVTSPKNFPPKQVPVELPVAVWLSEAGYVVGMPGGQAIELQPDRVIVRAGLVGRSALLQRRGRTQIVTPVNAITVDADGLAVNHQVGV